MSARLIVEADGGSRGNPGPAGYGAVVRDAATGAVLAEESQSLGQATNNVAEYSGLIAGLRAAARLAPGAEIEVRMDSKLVVEQMSGRWQIKHPGLRPLAREAAQAARGFAAVRYVWVPRARNAHADRLANQAMDAAGAGRAGGARPARRSRPGSAAASGPVPDQEPPPESSLSDGERRRATQAAGFRSGEERAGAGRIASSGTPGWGAAAGPPATTILLRHGETPLSPQRRFAGRGDFPLTQTGARQAEAAARRIAARGGADLVVTSPLARARGTAEAVAAATGAALAVDEAFIEADFGEWEGLTHAEAATRWPEQMAAWTADPAAAPPGGESFAAVQRRVLAGLDALIAAHPERTLVVVSHVTPMKMLLAHALLAPLESLRRMRLDVACLCEVDWYPGGTGMVRSLNDTAHLHAEEWADSALC